MIWPAVKLGQEDTMTLEEVGKTVDKEFEKFVQFVEHEVRPNTRKELSELLRKASTQLAKMAESLSK
jgi:hypothetical protein